MTKTDKMANLVPPHGGKLLPRLIDGERRGVELKGAETLFQIRASSREISDLIMLAMGAFSPLEGFMGREDYESVVSDMHLKSGVLWPIPITLAVSTEEAKQIKEGQNVALLNPESEEIIATMLVEEKYPADKRREAVQVFRTDSAEHPGVRSVYEQGEVYLGGAVKVLSEDDYPQRFPEYARPEETRALFAGREWTTVAAFQTRNPMHRSHEYLTKIALEVCDGLLIHPIVGKLKSGDIPAEVRMKCYQALLDNYFPKERVVLKVYPMEMRYGGPREAVLHAIIRQNFGCSHIIIGRDHAGVGNYYGHFDAQQIFDELNPEDLHIRPLKLDSTFWCHRCDSMASAKTCPHGSEDRLLISGTRLRDMLSNGEKPPEQFSRKVVTDILLKYYQGRNPDQG